MKSFNCVVTAENGIHARPAGLLVKEAGKYKSKISLVGPEKTADAKGLFSLMGMGAKMGTQLRVEVDGEDEDLAIENIRQFLLENFCSEAVEESIVKGSGEDDCIKG